MLKLKAPQKLYNSLVLTEKVNPNLNLWIKTLAYIEPVFGENETTVIPLPDGNFIIYQESYKLSNKFFQDISKYVAVCRAFLLTKGFLKQNQTKESIVYFHQESLQKTTDYFNKYTITASNFSEIMGMTCLVAIPKKARETFLMQLQSIYTPTTFKYFSVFDYPCMRIKLSTTYGSVQLHQISKTTFLSLNEVDSNRRVSLFRKHWSDYQKGKWSSDEGIHNLRINGNLGY